MKKIIQLFIFLQAIGLSSIIQPMAKTSTKLTVSAKPKMHFPKKAISEIYKDISQKYSNITNSRIYTDFFEPIYVGNKANEWGHQLINFYNTPTKAYKNYLSQKGHKTFYKKIYQQWKNNLSQEELQQHHDVIKSYEESYENYFINPTDPDLQQELLHQTQRIYQTLHDHPASISKNYNESFEKNDYRFID